MAYPSLNIGLSKLYISKKYNQKGFLEPIPTWAEERGEFPLTSTSSSQIPTGCPGIQLNSNSTCLEIAADSTGWTLYYLVRARVQSRFHSYFAQVWETLTRADSTEVTLIPFVWNQSYKTVHSVHTHTHTSDASHKPRLLTSASDQAALG